MASERRRTVKVDIGTAANSILTARQKDHERACKAKEEASKKPIEEVMAAMAEKNDVWRKKHELAEEERKSLNYPAKRPAPGAEKLRKASAMKPLGRARITEQRGVWYSHIRPGGLNASDCVNEVSAPVADDLPVAKKRKTITYGRGKSTSRNTFTTAKPLPSVARKLVPKPGSDASPNSKVASSDALSVAASATGHQNSAPTKPQCAAKYNPLAKLVNGVLEANSKLPKNPTSSESNPALFSGTVTVMSESQDPRSHNSSKEVSDSASSANQESEAEARHGSAAAAQARPVSAAAKPQCAAKYNPLAKLVNGVLEANSKLPKNPTSSESNPALFSGTVTVMSESQDPRSHNSSKEVSDSASSANQESEAEARHGSAAAAQARPVSAAAKPQCAAKYNPLAKLVNGVLEANSKLPKNPTSSESNPALFSGTVTVMSESQDPRSHNSSKEVSDSASSANQESEAEARHGSAASTQARHSSAAAAQARHGSAAAGQARQGGAAAAQARHGSAAAAQAHHRSAAAAQARPVSAATKPRYAAKYNPFANLVFEVLETNSKLPKNPTSSESNPALFSGNVTVSRSDGI